MKLSCLQIVRGVITVALVACLAMSASAKYEVKSLSELVAQAELVLLVAVGETRETGSDDGWTYLSSSLEVKKAFKGICAEKKIDVGTRLFPAGKEDEPLLLPKAGSEAIVFLRKAVSKDALFKTPWVLSNAHQGIMVKDAKGVGSWDGLLADLAKGGK